MTQPPNSNAPPATDEEREKLLEIVEADYDLTKAILAAGFRLPEKKRSLADDALPVMTRSRLLANDPARVKMIEIANKHLYYGAEFVDDLLLAGFRLAPPVTVTDKMIERAARRVASESHGMDPDQFWEYFVDDVRITIETALTPALPTEPEPRAGGPTS